MHVLQFLFKGNSKKIKAFVNRNALLLDVRTQEEWDAAHLENAIHIPLNNLKAQINTVIALNKPIVAYCKRGVRSDRATKLLKQHGIEAINGGAMTDLQRIIS